MIDSKPSAGFWITVALVVVLVGYPLSMGPAVWLATKPWCPDSIAGCYHPIYDPIYWLHDHAPESVSHAIRWYVWQWN